MAGFWSSGTGKKITGSPDDAFVKNFSIIPEGTIADALIKSFKLEEKESSFDGSIEKFYGIEYKILNGDFANRTVNQKIKVFSGKPDQIDRNLNMLKLIMDLCQFVPSHGNAPTTEDLLPMQNKIVCITIAEYAIPTDDGKLIEGNWVREVHKAGSIAPETGVKVVNDHKPTVSEKIEHAPVESALTRNAAKKADLLDDDIPF
jgi:hypothetical protein